MEVTQQHRQQAAGAYLRQADQLAAKGMKTLPRRMETYADEILLGQHDDCTAVRTAVASAEELSRLELKARKYWDTNL